MSVRLIRLMLSMHFIIGAYFGDLSTQTKKIKTLSLLYFVKSIKCSKKSYNATAP
jgi:hypothetical protein